MTRSDRDLVAAIRAELAAIDPGRACDRVAESAGLGTALAMREASVARLAVRLGRTTDAGILLASSHRAKHVRARAGAEGPGDATSDTAFAWGTSADHCRWAFLRGRFLARGSLSIANGRTHLEFVVPLDEAAGLAAALAEMDLPASWRTRRGRGVVTWKGAETVTRFLGRIGAGAGLLELESRHVSRALRGELNRVINAESANLERAVAAAGRQLAAIADLDADGRLATQSYVVRASAEARRETPEATLSELAERLGFHRSAVQRAFDRIERLVVAPDPEAGPRSSARLRGAARSEARIALA